MNRRDLLKSMLVLPVVANEGIALPTTSILHEKDDSETLIDVFDQLGWSPKQGGARHLIVQTAGSGTTTIMKAVATYHHLSGRKVAFMGQDFEYSNWTTDFGDPNASILCDYDFPSNGYSRFIENSSLLLPNRFQVEGTQTVYATGESRPCKATVFQVVRSKRTDCRHHSQDAERHVRLVDTAYTLASRSRFADLAYAATVTSIWRDASVVHLARVKNRFSTLSDGRRAAYSQFDRVIDIPFSSLNVKVKA